MTTEKRSHGEISYRLLTQSQIEEIHRASLEILETVGVRVGHDEAVQLLADRGCRVKKDNTVLYPNWLVEESIHSAPSRITVYNREGEEAMCLEGRNNYYGMGTDLIYSYVVQTGEMRSSLLEDVVYAARVADYLPEIDFCASYALPHDVPTNTMYIECVKAQLENTTKPIFFTAAGKEDLEYIFEMAAAVAGGMDKLREKPFLIHYSEPTPPLTISYGAAQKLMLCAEKGIPINFTPFTILGGSAPVSLAGGIAQANAEALSGLVLHQIKGKGSPIVSGITIFPMDMRHSTVCYGSPEFRLTNSAFSDIYHYYKLPMWSTVGSDSHCVDQQAAMEHTFSTIMASMDGANLIHDVGYLGQGLVGSPAALVMCSEIIAYTKRLLRGFDISRQHLAIDVIRQVGPGNTFLAEEHTARMLRQELWVPKYSNRLDVDTWMAGGRKSFGDIVTQKAIEILETHQPKPLAGDARAIISAIGKRAEDALANFHFKA